MPEIINSHLTHITWGLICLVVAILVHVWPTIKAKVSSGWASLKASLQKEDAKGKALVEIVSQEVQAKWLEAFDGVADDVKALLTRLETMEKNFTAGLEELEDRVALGLAELHDHIEAQVRADEAKASAVVQTVEALPLIPASIGDDNASGGRIQ